MIKKLTLCTIRGEKKICYFITTSNILFLVEHVALLIFLVRGEIYLERKFGKGLKIYTDKSFSSGIRVSESTVSSPSPPPNTRCPHLIPR